MSMLAEPRRKQKVINLRAKNSAWSNDSNKFGQRMLEKMGWSSGKGLGANENGIVDHVVAKYKNDEKGLGFEDRNDQWTKHEDDFNALLSNLSSGDTNDEKLHSGISLEDKSKKSKARVHYHKFTRGKDLTKYSEKDLANIFGKKTFKSKEKLAEEPCEDVKTTEQIFTEKGSMDDYFKNKMAKLNLKNKIVPLINHYDDESDYTFRGFSGTTIEMDHENSLGIGFRGFSCNTLENNKLQRENENCIDDSLSLLENKKKSKKKKKSKHQDTEKVQIDENDCLINQNTLVINNEDTNQEDLNVVNIDINERKTKKSKKKKYHFEVNEDISNKKKKKAIETLEENQIEEYIPKKKKKTKNKEV